MRTPGFLRLAITPGCPAGVGPELVARAVVHAALPKTVHLRFTASAALLEEGARRAGLQTRRDGDRVVVIDGDHARAVEVDIADALDPGRATSAGVVDDGALACQRDSLLRACVLAARGDAHAIVTGPVRKKALTINGITYPGQTEVVHHHLAVDDEPPLMVFAGGPFVLGLLTVHVALRDVPGLITTAAVERGVRRLRDAARAILDVEEPHVRVLGVNPHAGEGGLFGDEELRVVTPTIELLRKQGLDVQGPIPADGFFADVARHKKGATTMRGVHAVLAMHHDQGLAPYKLLVGGEGINVTWGLRVPRTSPDHGTADSIAGQGLADPSSMIAALELAHRLAKKNTVGAAPIAL